MEPAFTDPPHIRLLVDLLTQLENPNSGVNRLCVSLPPRFGKTTLCSQLFAAWAIGRDSRRSVILANHSSELATGFSRKCKQYVEAPSWPFPKIEMSEDSRATHRWNVSPGGGGLFSVGIGSGLTGIGMDLGIVDDPVNDALSQVERDQAWAWFREVFTPRQNASAKLLVVSARLALDDLPGHLAESSDAGEWRFVSLPAVNEDGNELGLEPGMPLWDRFDLKALAERREAMGEGPYFSQYLQNPSIAAGGNFFRMECFGTWTTLPALEPPVFNPLQHFYQSPLDVARQEEDCFVKISGIDCAGTDNVSSGGSFNAIVTILVNLIDGRVYVLDCERWRNIEFFALRQNIVLHLARHSPNQVICEANDGTGGRILGDLSRTTPWPLRGVKPKSSKTSRALEVVGMIESGKVFLPAQIATDGLAALRKELSEFGPGARYTDCTDALVWSLLATRQHIAARREDRAFDRQMENFSLFR
jgi:phage terminase large subunit-like protein